MRPLLLALGLGALALGGCDGDSDAGGRPGDRTAQEKQQAEAPPECRLAPGVEVAALDESVKGPGEDKLKHARSVAVTDAPEAPPRGFEAGAYVVSAQLLAPGVQAKTLSWVVSREMHDTGNGPALAADPVTRELSAPGTTAGRASPVAAYIAAIRSSNAYARSRACAEGD